MNSLPIANIAEVKDASDIVANAATAMAIVIGAGWAYWRFLRERTRWPRAALTLEFDPYRLDDSTNLLGVKLLVTNEGRGLMRITELRFDLYQVRPLEQEMRAKISADCAHLEKRIEAEWPSLQQRVRTWEKGERPELEPEERDEFRVDFFVDRSVETVFLYAYLENVKKRKFRRRVLGWTVTAYRDMTEPPKRGRLAALVSGRTGAS
jgi:hypothetical protein